MRKIVAIKWGCLDFGPKNGPTLDMIGCRCYYGGSVFRIVQNLFHRRIQ